MQITPSKARIDFRGCRRHWLPLVVIGLSLLMTFERAASQEATPTPNVNTVPRPEQIFTPTSTPPPVVVPIVTATSVNPAPAPSSATTTAPANQTDNSSPATNPSILPASPTQPPRGGGSQIYTSLPTQSVDDPLLNTVVQRADLPLSMTVQLDRAYLWPGQQFSLLVVLTNLGEHALTDLRLRYALPVELALQTAATTQLGDVQQEPLTAGRVPLLISWPSLAAGDNVTATLTLQVSAQTTNGRLLDTQIMASVAGYDDIATQITLVMPPAQLPQFR